MTQVVAWLNLFANAVGQVCLAPLHWLPGWVAATIVAVVTGIVMLVVIKYTSNQTAVRQARNRIKANLYALSLFKEDIGVNLRCQGKILLGVPRMLALAVVPMLVMLIPMTLVLGQLSLWFQFRPLGVGEEAVVLVQLAQSADVRTADLELVLPPEFEQTLGPVRVASQRQACWNIRAVRPGYAQLAVRLGSEQFTKQLAAGDGLMRISAARPGWNWWPALEYPAEPPFRPESPVSEITIQYPARPGWVSGTDYWIWYWFGGSMVAALCFRRVLNVEL